MKKIFMVFALLVVLSGCQLTSSMSQDEYDKLKNELQQELENNYEALNQEALEQIEIKLRQELIDENNNQLSDIEKMIINVVETKKGAVLGVSNYQNDVIVSTGSGVIYKHDETKNEYYVITNHHVVEDSDKLSVVLPDNRNYDAILLGSDKRTDLAVIKFSSDKIFTIVDLADSDVLKSGQFAIAIGNPLGYDYYGSVTFGVISGLDRYKYIDFDEDGTPEFYTSLIQHDVPISPGNSGGALFDINGNLIGINNMKSVEENVDNIGFAIPSNTVIKVASILETDGIIRRPSLGIKGGDLEDINGAYISEIIPNTSAYYSDLKPGDIIIKYNSVIINCFADLRLLIDNALIDDEVILKVNRNGVILDINLTLIESPE